MVFRDFSVYFLAYLSHRLKVLFYFGQSFTALSEFKEGNNIAGSILKTLLAAKFFL